MFSYINFVYRSLHETRLRSLLYPNMLFLLGADAFSTVVSSLARYSKTWRCVSTVQTIIMHPHTAFGVDDGLSQSWGWMVMVSLERERKLQGCLRCLVGCLDKKYPVWSGRRGVFVIHDKEWIKWIGSQCNVRDDAELSFQDA